MEFSESSPDNPALTTIVSTVRLEAEQAQGDVIQLLALLRTLEQLHRER